MEGEVDFPNWWQAKVIKAKDYISAAQHYLEFEEKQPALDAMALEERVTSEYEDTLKWAVNTYHDGDPEVLKAAIEYASIKAARGLGGREATNKLFRQFHNKYDQDVIMRTYDALMWADEEDIEESKQINERGGDLENIIHDIRVHGEESGDIQGTAAEYIFYIANAFDINLNDIKDYLFEEQGPGELDKIYDVILKYVKDPDEAMEELDNFISQGKDGFSDELYANLSRDPEFRLALKETVENMIQKKKLNEAEATCCHRCGRKHVKGTACKKPYLKKSNPRHCANK
jgi:hypothetical protein